jgi:thiol-disulfide isomerase/thioredoxin
MKKALTFLVIIFSVLTLTIKLNAGDRMMIIEFFTSSTCGPCASNNPYLTAFVNGTDPDRIAAIGFHMSWPSPGNDPMYLHNSSENDARRSYYGINSIPQSQFDGLITVYSPYSQALFQGYYDSRKDILSPVTIIVRDSLYGDSVLTRISVYCETMLSSPTATLLIGVYENAVHYTYPPGTNGEKDFNWVMRKMLPNASGTPITLTPGSLQTFEHRYKMNPVWVASEMRTVAYIQTGSTKEVLGVAKRISNFSLISNTGFFSVPQGQASVKNYRVKVPYVAAGYNSPVTFTAEVQPPTSGITVSYPSGNIMNNFPDSLAVQVNSTAAVAVGTYKIVVTGTNGAGKYHKIALDYLIGRNYVNVNSNNPTLTFSVNNVQYTNSKIFDWSLGSAQTIQAVSPQVFGNTRYVFVNWSDAGDTSHNITVNSTVNSYTVNYKKQIKILASALPSGIPVTVVNGNLFHDSGAVVTVSSTPSQVLFNGKQYYFNHWTGIGSGSYSGTNPSFQVTMLSPIIQTVIYDTVNTGITQNGTEIPVKFSLSQNYPNPFNPVTKIKFDVAKFTIAGLKIFDLSGRLVSNLFSGNLSPGKYEYSFDAGNLSSGVYFYRFETEYFTDTKRMIVVK